MQYVLMFLLFTVALFLIVLVLIQRGRGGGLAGAFGGMGGQSAFGTKAGDLFTRITVVAATVWILLCVITVKYLGSSGDILGTVGRTEVPRAIAPAGGGAKQPAQPGAAGGAPTTPPASTPPASAPETSAAAPATEAPPAAATEADAPPTEAAPATTPAESSPAATPADAPAATTP